MPAPTNPSPDPPTQVCHAILRHAPDAVLLIDQAGSTRYANPRAEGLLGAGRTDLLGASFGFPLVTGETTELDLAGGRRVAEMRVTEVLWEDEPMFLAMLRDISDRKRMELRLRESEERYRSLVDTAPDGILVCVDETVIYANASARMLAGELRPGTALPELLLSGCMARWRQQVNAGGGALDVGFWAGHELRVARVTLSLCQWQEQPAVHGIWRDVTEELEHGISMRHTNQTLKKIISEELSKSRAKDLIMLQQARLAAMGEMIHNIAHQWRQPLSAIGLLLDNLLDAWDFKELDRSLLEREVSTGVALVRRMSQTIDDFRNFFRPGREPEEYLISQMLADTMNMVQASLANHGCALEVSGDTSFSCRGFPREVSQVLLNLVGNARDAMMERGIRRGRIRVHVRPVDGDHFEISVADNAGGVDPALRERIFEPYFSTKPQGSGIGLAMSRMLAAHMQGELTLDCAPDGCMFRLRLPRHWNPLRQETLTES